MFLFSYSSFNVTTKTDTCLDDLFEAAKKIPMCKQRRCFPGGSVVKNPPAYIGDMVWSLGWKDPRKRKWQPLLVFLPGKSHGHRSLVGYSPQGHKEPDKSYQHKETKTNIAKGTIHWLFFFVQLLCNELFLCVNPLCFS